MAATKKRSAKRTKTTASSAPVEAPPRVLDPTRPLLGVKNWKRFQHYGDRPMAWLKLYVSLLDDYVFERLSERAQLALIKVWLLASRDQGRILFDLPWLARKFAMPALGIGVWQELVAAGFLEPLTPPAAALLTSQQPTQASPSASLPASAMLATQRREDRESSLREESEDFDQFCGPELTRFLEHGAAALEGATTPDQGGAP